MATLQTKTRLYLYKNGINLFPFADPNKPLVRIDFAKEVVIGDLGNGPTITGWNLPVEYNNILQPTTDQLNALDAEASIWDNYNNYSINRNNSFNNIGIGNQLDLIWHAIDQGLTLDKNSDFYKQIKAIKDEYPKTPAWSSTLSNSSTINN